MVGFLAFTTGLFAGILVGMYVKSTIKTFAKMLGGEEKHDDIISH